MGYSATASCQSTEQKTTGSGNEGFPDKRFIMEISKSHGSDQWQNSIRRTRGGNHQ
jgi:hypothetical protein